MNRKIVSLLICCVILFSLLPNIYATTTIIANGTCGENLTWELDAEGVLTISGTGNMDAWESGGSPWYYNREKIKNVIISEGVTSVGTYAFAWCGNLTSISFPDTLKSLGQCAFYACFNLPKVMISKGVENVAEAVFLDCSKLYEINVSNENDCYGSENGVLFNKDKTELVCYPIGKPDSQYIIPNTVAVIRKSSFRSCVNLDSLIIPDNIKSVEEFAFYRCENLTDVYYYGTEDEKAEIVIGGYNSVFSSANWNYLGIELDKKDLSIVEGETVQLIVLSSSGDVVDANVIWESSDDSVAKVESGVITAVKAGQVVITAKIEDGKSRATCSVRVNKNFEEKKEYSFKQSVQIGLIEPWFLKVNVRVYTDENPVNIDYSTLVDYGAYVIRKSELNIENATQDTVTVSDIINDSDTVKYSKKIGTATIDGSYITANYDKGLYTYEFDDSIFVLFYIEDEAGITYAPIRERNLKKLLEDRKDDVENFPNEYERNVYQNMLNMYNSVKQYRDDYYKNN